MKEFVESHNFKNPPSELFRDIACSIVDFYNLTQECCGSDNRMEYPKMNKRLSNCCSATVEYDSDICSDCKEHCALECPDCEDGWIEVVDESRLFGKEVIDVPFKKIICETCSGEGVVEA